MPPPSHKPPRDTLWRTIRTVAWALLGVRGRKRHEEDAPSLSPFHIAVIALGFMLVFASTLVALAISIAGR